MAKYQKYAEYKDSGIDWLGEIPRHWDLKPIKYLFEIINGSTPKSGEEAFWDGEITWITPSDLSKLRSHVIGESIRTITKKGLDSCGTTLVPSDTIILSCRAPIGSLAVTSKEACTNQGCKSLVKKYDLSTKFFYYYLSISTKQLNNLGRGTTFLELSSDELGSYALGIPNAEEQTQIANFLDHEAAKIDTLIAKQEKLIELLKEKRQAVISHAVTKGLNPDAAMKDSGVEWLGQVPEHWDIIAISKVTQKITNGYVGPTRDILVEEGIPYVQATHIKKGKVNFDNAYFVREKWSNDHAKSILKKDDVLIVQTGAGTGDVGLVSESEEGFNCHALIILQPKKQQLSGSYLAYCLQSDYGYATLYSIRTGGMHPHLNCGEVQFVKISVPPLDEQVAISKFIEKNIQDFDQLIEKVKLAIQLMQERRTALISSAVTGKINVSNWQHPNEAKTEFGA